jgi:hypothetical protein
MHLFYNNQITLLKQLPDYTTTVAFIMKEKNQKDKLKKERNNNNEIIAK